MTAALQKLSLWFRERWARRTGLVTVSVYLAAVEVVLLLWREGAQLLKPDATGPTGWIIGVGFCLLLCLIALGLGWFRRVAMWRLRNRLIVTYVFIGVIPVVLLVTITLLAAYLFAGQFASFVINSHIRADFRAIETVNQAIAENLFAQTESGASLEKALSGIRPIDSEHTLTIWENPEKGVGRAYSFPAGSAVVPMPPETMSKRPRAIVGLRDGLHLYVWTTRRFGKTELTVISAQPLGKAQLERMAAGLGEITLIAPDFSAPRAGATKSVTNRNNQTFSSSIVIGKDSQVRLRTSDSEDLPSLPPVTVGVLPQRQQPLDYEITFGSPFGPVVDWNSNAISSALLTVHSRPSLVYAQLFPALGGFANSILTALIVIGIVFALIELVALITGIRLTRTSTKSIAALYQATEHINRGDLDYRIKVTRQDQLAALESSFNSMSESLKKLIIEQKEKQRMQSELAIAQEVQAQLFPHEATHVPGLEVHGVCRPARTVSGDYYDFLQLGPERLGIAVGDISGKGISAALLMATIHSAVRVYEFGRAPEREQLVAAGAAMSVAGSSYSSIQPEALQSPAAVLTMLNRHLFQSTPPEKYATLFLGVWNAAGRQFSYCNAGHLPPLVIGADGSLRRLQTGGTVIGLFDDMQWEDETVQLHPGDLFIAYSDGITEPENEFGEFGEKRLLELVQENRHLPLARISELIVSSVCDWIGAAEQPDDMMIVLARAR